MDCKENVWGRIGGEIIVERQILNVLTKFDSFGA